MSLPKKILVPVDGSEPSIRAAHMAANIVDKEGEIHIIYVVKPYSGDYSGMSFSGFQLPDELAEKANSEWEKIANKIVDKVAEEIQGENITIHRIIAKGDPVALICKVAKNENFDLISMGSRGVGGIIGTLGSVSSRVSQHSSCPVLINH